MEITGGHREKHRTNSCYGIVRHLYRIGWRHYDQYSISQWKSERSTVLKIELALSHWPYQFYEIAIKRRGLHARIRGKHTVHHGLYIFGLRIGIKWNYHEAITMLFLFQSTFFFKLICVGELNVSWGNNNNLSGLMINYTGL